MKTEPTSINIKHLIVAFVLLLPVLQTDPEFLVRGSLEFYQSDRELDLFIFIRF